MIIFTRDNKKQQLGLDCFPNPYSFKNKFLNANIVGWLWIFTDICVFIIKANCGSGMSCIVGSWRPSRLFWSGLPSSQKDRQTNRRTVDPRDQSTPQSCLWPFWLTAKNVAISSNTNQNIRSQLCFICTFVSFNSVQRSCPLFHRRWTNLKAYLESYTMFTKFATVKNREKLKPTTISFSSAICLKTTL